MAALLPPHPVTTGLFKSNGEPSTHPLFVKVDPVTFHVIPASSEAYSNSTDVNSSTCAERTPAEEVQGLYAMGPLRGDNFVRFLVGDAFGVVKHILGSSTKV